MTADYADSADMMVEIIHKELSGKIINAAMHVLNQLKPGLDEKIYEKSLTIELRARGHTVEQQKKFPVYYRDIEVGTLIPDMIVDDLIIVDPKVVVSFNENHIAQMTGYLAISNLQLAMLLNFKYSKLGWKRVVRTGSAPSA